MANRPFRLQPMRQPATGFWSNAHLYPADEIGSRLQSSIERYSEKEFIEACSSHQEDPRSGVHHFGQKRQGKRRRQEQAIRRQKGWMSTR